MKARVLALLALGLSGCAGVADNRGLNTITVVVKKDDALVVGERVLISWRNQWREQKKEVATDSAGQAAAEFTFMWNSYFWIVPPLGNIPRKSESPQYSIGVAGEEVAVLTDSTTTTYDAKSGVWKTKVYIYLSKPDEPPLPMAHR